MTKAQVQDFWEEASCGEVYATGEDAAAQLTAQARARYALEPYIPGFARFADARGRRVLEIGVGMGADHLEWARHEPRELVGVDFTARALEHTASRLRLAGYRSHLIRGDAERLPLSDASMDLVYSWGVLHHTPDTAGAIREVRRVLRPGGIARIMIYHRRSIVGALLWLRYALLVGAPRRSLDEVYAHHLESPGTKAYSVAEGEGLFTGFADARVSSQLSFADLLQGAVGQRHAALGAIRRLWPRWLIRRLLPATGLYLLVEARR
jgi:SAM-dependent methyltransferase